MAWQLQWLTEFPSIPMTYLDTWLKSESMVLGLALSTATWEASLLGVKLSVHKTN